MKVVGWGGAIAFFKKKKISSTTGLQSNFCFCIFVLLLFYRRVWGKDIVIELVAALWQDQTKLRRVSLPHTSSKALQTGHSPPLDSHSGQDSRASPAGLIGSPKPAEHMPAPGPWYMLPSVLSYVFWLQRAGHSPETLLQTQPPVSPSSALLTGADYLPCIFLSLACPVLFNISFPYQNKSFLWTGVSSIHGCIGGVLRIKRHWVAEQTNENTNG